MTFPVALSAFLFYVFANVVVRGASLNSLLTSLDTSEYFPLNPGFEITKVASTAVSLPSHSWEFGTAAEALLELYNKEYSVYGANPFPVPKLDPTQVASLSYAVSNIDTGSSNGLTGGNGAVGDPISLGVSAVLLGKTNSAYTTAMVDSIKYLFNEAPRFYNGAISQRVTAPELWADWMYMVPPAMAYYGADTNNGTLIQQAVQQCGLYRQVLKANLSSSTPYNGVWEHIIGPLNQDTGIWSTGNSWAAAGMARVLATVQKAPVASASSWQTTAISNLEQWIGEIINGIMATNKDQGLVRNYVNNMNVNNGGFGETSGSSLLAATIYRMVVLSPDKFTSKHIAWADAIRTTLAGKDSNGNPHVTTDGIVTPAVNPMNWKDTQPFTSGSPEGQSFVVMMYSAWRDCVQAGVCSVSDNDLLSAASPPVCPNRTASNGLRRRSRILRRHRRSQSGLSHQGREL